MALSISQVAARRYARALIDVATADGLGERCIDDLEKFGQVVSAEPRLRDLFDNPTVPVPGVTSLVAELGGKLGLHPTSMAFLSILATRRRLGGLDRIIAEYRVEQDAIAGRSRGTIRTAGPVSDVQADRIARMLGDRIGRKLTLDRKIDESLIGGLQVTVGDKVYDLSTRTYLNSLRSRLLQNR